MTEGKLDNLFPTVKHQFVVFHAHVGTAIYQIANLFTIFNVMLAIAIQNDTICSHVMGKVFNVTSPSVRRERATTK